MPLHILIPMVVLGIAGITVLLHVLGQSRRATLEDEDAATRAWLREFPEARPSRVILSHDRHAALIETDAGAGVVWPMGMDTAARALDGARITRTNTGLRIDLPDFSAPRIHLTLDEEEAGSWPDMMEEKSA